MVVVPKKDGKVRTCVDYTILNKSVDPERLILPEVSESLAQIHPEAKYFSKLDATAGFYHIPLDYKSQLLTTFITPFGRYAFRRLPMGITSAPERFQKEMMETLEGLEGIVNVADDTLIFGRTKAEHDVRLHQVLKRLKERNLKLNKHKCIFGVQKLTFLGHVVSKDGISVDPNKIKAIMDMPAPEDVSGVRQLLGCIQVHAKFIPWLADIASPIYQLLSKKNEFVWTEDHQAAFSNIKKALTSAPILAHFAPGRPTRVAADASSYGVGAVLEQKVEGAPWRPICYASRTMSETEKRYAQIEREALASTWACEKFKQFLLGQNFVIQTDHKPLVELLGSKPIADLPARIQRFRMRLTQFNYTMEYIPGREMIIPDMLSRAPINSAETGEDALLIEEVEIFVKNIEKAIPILDTRLQQIKDVQKADPQTKRLERYIKDGWPAVRELPPEDKIFAQFQGEMVSLGGLVARGNRIYIPPSLRIKILNKIHEGHLGVTKCRSRAKETVWWPGISSQISNKVAQCEKCVEYRIPPTESLKPPAVPDYPWQIIGVDLFDIKGRPYLVVVDYFSRFIEVANLINSTAEEIISKMKTIMARWGIPETVRSDNGPCFNGYAFKQFANQYGFTHTTSSPTFPQSNGQAESAVKIAKTIILKSEDPNLGLLSYRTAKLECGYSPAQLIMGRCPRTTLPVKREVLTPKWPYIQDFRQRREAEIKNQTTNFNRHHRTRSLSPLRISDRVWITNTKCYGKIVNIGPEPRSYAVVSKNSVFRRNRAHLIHVKPGNNLEDYAAQDDFELPDDTGEKSQDQNAETESVQEEEGEGEIEQVEDERNNREMQNIEGNNQAVGQPIDLQYYTTRSGRTVRPPRWKCSCADNNCNH